MTLFEALYKLKTEGYDYLNADHCDCHTGYDQAVSDFYEGGRDYEPTYLSWLKETIDFGTYEIDDSVFYHNGALLYGSISKGEINSLVFSDFTSDIEIKNRISIIEKIIDGEPDLVGISAIAVWNFGLEKENDRITNIIDFAKGIQNENNGFCITNYEIYSLLFVDSKCWTDSEFITGAAKLLRGIYSNTEALEYLCKMIDPSIRTVELTNELKKVLNKYNNIDVSKLIE